MRFAAWDRLSQAEIFQSGSWVGGHWSGTKKKYGLGFEESMAQRI